LEFDEPGQQRRWTVLLRLILAVPQLIVIFVLEIALIVTTVIGWFAALVMGRLPNWVHQYNSGFLSLYVRFCAYLSLLTDEYPPFEFDTWSYPVRPVLPPPGRQNRLAVLFRIILAVPASFFQAIVSFGLSLPMLFVTWLIMVFTGRMPRGLYWAFASLVRYMARFTGYILLITPEYPWGMLGDRGPDALPAYPPPFGSSASPSAYAPPAPFASPPAPTVAASTPTANDTLGEAAASVPPAAAPAWPPPPPPGFAAPGTAAPPPPWDPAPPPPPPPGAYPERSKLVLPRSSRNWLVFAIVWGSIVLVAYGPVLAFVVNSTNTTVNQYNTIVHDFNDSKAKIETAIADSRSCTTVACLRPSHLAAATSLDKFDSELAAMNLPSNALAPAQVVESDLSQMASVFNDLAYDANAQAYRSTIQRSNLQTLLNSWPNDTNTLLDALRTHIY
jgi:hypothetical protein